MQLRKLDMGKAWTQATGLIGANRDLVGVLAGVFLFLPVFVLMMALLSSGIDFSPQGGEPNPERIAAQINALLMANWWSLLLVLIGQLCASIAILSLLGDPGRPTVREVLQNLPRLLLPVLGAQLLIGLITQLPSLLAGLLPELAEALVSFLLLPVTLYLTIKFSLAIAVIVLGSQRNPIEALRRSWQLTKANSFRLFGFFLMLTLLFMVIALILLLVVGLVFAALGDRVALFGNAAFFALMLTVFYTISYALTVAIYRQLSQPVPDGDADLFE